VSGGLAPLTVGWLWLGWAWLVALVVVLVALVVVVFRLPRVWRPPGPPGQNLVLLPSWAAFLGSLAGALRAAFGLFSSVFGWVLAGFGCLFGSPGLRPGELYPVLPGSRGRPGWVFFGPVLGPFSGSFWGRFRAFSGPSGRPRAFGPKTREPAPCPGSARRFLFSALFGWFSACFWPVFRSFGPPAQKCLSGPSGPPGPLGALGPFRPFSAPFVVFFLASFWGSRPGPGALVPVCWAFGPDLVLGP